MYRDQISLARHPNTRGFTLVEVLVTLVVFSMLSISGITILSQSISTKDQADRLSQSVEQLRRTHVLFKSDFAQLATRPTRDRFGARNGVVFSGGVGFENQPILQFVRDGWDNPSGLERRSSLQKVEYRVEERDLVRRAYLQPDSATDDQYLDLTVLEDVEAVSVSFFVQGQWYDAWSVAAEGSKVFPSAVAVTLTASGLGEIRQVFQTSGLVL